MSRSSSVMATTPHRFLENRFAQSGFVLAAALLAVLLTATLCAAGAQWNPNGVPVCTAPNYQHDQQVISDGAGGAFVVWTDERSRSGAINNYSDIYAQRIDAGGRALWQKDGLPVTTATREQYNPCLTSDGAGGIIVAWMDSKSGNWNIYAQRLNGSGKALWAPNGVPVDNNPMYQSEIPQIASDGAGGAIVIYQANISNWHLLSQRINQSGVTQWGAPVTISPTVYPGPYVIIPSDGSGAIIAWTDIRNGWDNSDIYVQKLDNAGSEKWTAGGAPVCAAGNRQWYPQMASDGAGGGIATWQDARSNKNWDIYAQRMKSSGAPAWKANGVSICNAPGDQESPMIASDGSGGAVVTWEDYRAGNPKIYAQKLSSGGTAATGGSPGWEPNGVALNPGGRNSYNPVIVSDGSGGAIVAWTEEGTGFIDGIGKDGSINGADRTMSPNGMIRTGRVFVQQVLSSGVISPGWAPDGVPVVPLEASEDNFSPQITTDGSGGAILAWQDFRNENLDIYAQRMRTTTSTWYLAEGSAAWGYQTFVTIQNPNAKQVTAKITYMTPEGAVQPQMVVLPPLSQTTVQPLDYLETEVDFSTKVECAEGRPIGVDRTMVWTGQGAASADGAGKGAPSPEAHNSVGVNAPAFTWYLPEGCSGFGFETWLLIQNPGAKDAVCTLTYMIEGGTPVTVQKAVPAHSRSTFNMFDDIGRQNASTRVSSNVPVITERAMYRNDRREGHGSVGATESSTDYFLAEGTTAWGFTTYVLVENPNAEACNVNLTYMTPGGPRAMQPFSMPGYSRKTVRVNDELPNSDFSTQVHADQPIIAERAMYWGADSPLGEAMHDTIGMVMPAGTFYLPDGNCTEGFETYTMVQNPNDTQVEVRITYMTPTGKDNVTFTETVPALSRVTFNMADKLTDGKAAVLVECLSKDKAVMAERSMYWNDRGAGTCTIGGASY